MAQRFIRQGEYSLPERVGSEKGGFPFDRAHDKTLPQFEEIRLPPNTNSRFAPFSVSTS
jgi:hypothetical protein